MADERKDIKGKIVSITIGTLCGLLMIITQVTFQVATKAANMQRDATENQKAIQQLIDYNKIQDMKIEQLEKAGHANNLQFQEIIFKLNAIEKKL